MANLLLIRDLCNSRKMTIRELSHRINRDESTIQCAIRKGSTNTGTLELIAKELGVSAGIFFDGFISDESKDLQREITHLRELLKEKERLIEVLMAGRKD